MGGLMKQTPKIIAVWLLSSLGWAVLCSAWSEAPNQITSIQLAPNGDLIFTVNGAGFDPQLLVRPLPQGNYQITIGSRAAKLNGPSELPLAEQIQTRIPAIESTLLSGDDTGFQLNLTSWQKLQPQILSNTPHKIVITLVGNRQRPPHSQAKFVAKTLAGEATPVKQPVKPESATSHPIKPLVLSPAKTKAVDLVAKSAPTEAPKQPEKPIQPQKVSDKRTEAEASPIPVRSTASAVVKSKAVEDSKTRPVASSPVSPVKAVSAAKRVSVPVRVASIAPKALEMDWLPIQQEPRPSQSLTPASPGHDLEALNFLSQSESATSGVAPIQPTSPEPEAQEKSALRLQKTPAGYELPTQPSVASQSSKPFAVPSVLSNEYTALLEPALQRAAEDLRNGRLDNAELSLRGLLAREPNHPQANYLLALTYLSPANQTSPSETDSSRKQEAQRLLETLMAHSPSLLVSQQLVELALDQDQLETASTLLKDALKQFPDNAWLWYLEGRVLEEGKHWDAAKSAYTQALGLDPHHPEYHYRLALMHMKQENWAACTRELNQALGIAPDDARYLKLMGYLAEKQVVPLAAAHYYKAALQSDAMLYYGRLLQQQKRTAEALSLYQAVESIAENDADLLLSLGTLYTEAKAPQRAQIVLKKLIQLIPDASDPRQSQARALLKQAKN